MTDTLPQLVALALSFNGEGNGEGYPGYSNPFSANLGRPNEYWCGDFVTDVYARAGAPLPSMQAGCQDGFAYVPDAESWAKAHGLWVPSWEGGEGDLGIFCWNGSGLAAHVELIYDRQGATLYTIGGDSGPSNVDSYSGQGGVHRHSWDDPAGSGNPQILGVVKASAAVHFGAAVPPRAPAPSEAPRSLMCKSPMMHGADVVAFENKAAAMLHSANINSDGHPDGIYGPTCRAACIDIQAEHNLTKDGICGPVTRGVMGLAA